MNSSSVQHDADRISLTTDSRASFVRTRARSPYRADTRERHAQQDQPGGDQRHQRDQHGLVQAAVVAGMTQRGMRVAKQRSQVAKQRSGVSTQRETRGGPDPLGPALQARGNDIQLRRVQAGICSAQHYRGDGEQWRGEVQQTEQQAGHQPGCGSVSRQ